MASSHESFVRYVFCCCGQNYSVGSLDLSLPIYMLFWSNGSLPVPISLKPARGRRTNAGKGKQCHWGLRDAEERSHPGMGIPTSCRAPALGQPAAPAWVPAPAGQRALTEDIQEQPCIRPFKISGSRGQRLLRFCIASSI